MARRVSAEVGSRVLHGLELDKRLGEFQILSYHLEDRTEPKSGETGSSPSADQLSLARRFERWPLTREGIYTALPPELCSFRLLELPFQSPKKIQQVVAYEAEGYLPFELDEILLEHLTASPGKQGIKVLVAGIERQQFSRFLEELTAAGIDPAVVGIQGLCLAALNRLEPRNGIRCRAYLDIGARQSRLCVVNEGRPIHVSSLTFGGDDLTRRLSEEFHLSLEQAEQGKIQEGRVGVPAAGVGTREARVVRTLEQGLSPLWLWLKNNRRWLSRWQEGEGEFGRWEELILCGGSANLRGLAELAERELKIPVRVFRFPSGLMPAEGRIAPEFHPQLAECLALAMAEGPNAVNFRKGEFAYRREAQVYRKKLAFPAALLLLCFIMLGARFWVSRSGAAAQVKQIRERTYQMVKETTGLAVSGDPVQFLEAKLKAEADKLEKYRPLQRPRAMEVLAAISEKIPAELSIELSKFTYHENRVQIEGETADFTSAKEIQDYLQAVPFFNKVALEDTRQSGSGRTRFNIQIQLRLPGEEGGSP